MLPTAHHVEVTNKCSGYCYSKNSSIRNNALSNNHFALCVKIKVSLGNRITSIKCQSIGLIDIRSGVLDNL